MKPRHASSYADRKSDRDRHHPNRDAVARDGAPKTEDSDHGRAADKPSDIPKKGWKDILWRTKEQMKEDNLSIVAAGVAFYVFLGLIPALGALVSIWGLVSEPATMQQQIDSMSGFLPQEAISILDEQMSSIAAKPSGATLGAIVGILLSIWSGAKAMKSVMMALNITYDEEETRGFFRLNLTAFVLTIAGIIGFLAAIGIIVALPIVLKTIGLDSTATALVNIVRWPLLAAFAVLGLGVLYRYGPDRDPARWRWVSWGAVFATIIWLAISAGFSFYVASFGNYNKTYGSLGAVVVFLLWFLLSAYVVLFGAELNAEMEHQTARDTTQGPDQPRGKRQAYVADDVGQAKRN